MINERSDTELCNRRQRQVKATFCPDDIRDKGEKEDGEKDKFLLFAVQVHHQPSIKQWRSEDGIHVH